MRGVPPAAQCVVVCGIYFELLSSYFGLLLRAILKRNACNDKERRRALYRHARKRSSALLGVTRLT